jgi:ATP diphosphatase
VNLARHLHIDPESALRHSNAKFERRFRFIEDSLAAEGRSVADTTLDDMEDRWKAAKRTE